MNNTPIREEIERIVHARNGKVNKKPTIDALEALLTKHTERAVKDAIIGFEAKYSLEELERAVLEGKIDELDRLYYKTPPENGMSDIIEDRIKTLKTQLEAKE